MNPLIKKAFSFNLLVAISSVSHAIEPRSFELGYFDIVPTITMGASRDDNVFRQPENEVDTTIWTVAPSLQALIQNGTSIYSLQADLFSGTYADSPEDNYTDWQIGATVQKQLTSNSLIDLFASSLQTHENRGTGFSEGSNITEETSDYEVQNYGLGYSYGAPESKGRLRLDLSYTDTSYDQASTGTAALARDNQSFGIETTFTLSALQHSDFLFQYRYRDIDYTQDSLELQGSQDSKEYYALLGMQWEAGSTLSGNLMVGRGEKKYASPARPDESIPSWSLMIDWSPYSYSSFSFTADKTFTEANATGNSIVNQTYGLTWGHAWSGRFSSSLGFTRADQRIGGVDRQDKTDSISVGLNYAFRRWIDFNLSYTNNVRDSDDALFAYTQQVISLGIQASF